MLVELAQARVHASVPANDLARARTFYEDKLGLRPSYQLDSALVYELGGGTRFSVFATPNPARGGHTQMGFSVPDVRAAVIELRRRGVRFEDYDEPALKTNDGVARINGHDSAWFKDSEGNFIELVGPS
jgi:catechol 2,3-dioxygenase-like lactoylglutathione lyase family enzyme